jgi:hypothetical protein
MSGNHLKVECPRRPPTGMQRAKPAAAAPPRSHVPTPAQLHTHGPTMGLAAQPVVLVLALALALAMLLLLHAILIHPHLVLIHPLLRPLLRPLLLPLLLPHAVLLHLHLLILVDIALRQDHCLMRYAFGAGQRAATEQQTQGRHNANDSWHGSTPYVCDAVTRPA